MLVYIVTQNDTNGNPRRGWIVGYGTDDPHFVDEGYHGRSAVERYGFTRQDAWLPRIVVTPGEYRDWKNLGAPELAA